jgi:hypothetical protein
MGDSVEINGILHNEVLRYDARGSRRKCRPAKDLQPLSVEYQTNPSSRCHKAASENQQMLGACSRNRIKVSAALLAGMIFAAPSFVAAQDEGFGIARFRSSYSSRVVQYGMNVGNELPSCSLGASLEHTSGVGGDFGTTWTVGSGGSFQSWTIGAGYEGELSDVTSYSISLARHQYVSDTANLLAPLANQIALGIDFALDPFSISIANDTYVGSSFADYLTVGFSAAIAAGAIDLMPEIDITVGSQEVSSAVSGKLKGKDKKKGVVYVASKVAGISGVTADIGAVWRFADGWSFVLDPSATYTPNDALRADPITLAIYLSLSRRIAL